MKVNVKVKAPEPVSETHFIEIEEPEPGKTCAVEVGPFKVLICNVNGELCAVENICTHARISLTTARLINGEIECPVHGARFDARSGIVMCPPARKGLRVFPLTRVAGGVEISLD